MMGRREGEEPDEEFLERLSEIPNDLYGRKPAPIFEHNDDEGDEGYMGDEDFAPEMEIPTFACPKPELGDLTNEDIEVLARLRGYNDCPACNDEDDICPKMFDHIAEVAVARILHLCCILAEMISGPRQTLMALGADTRADIDLSVISIVGEMNRLKNILPKLRVSQEEMDNEQRS